MAIFGWTDRKLVTAVNVVCGLSILFFGYDQGMMSGVNNSPDYVRTMQLGTTYTDPASGNVVVSVDNSLKLGGIVSVYYFGTLCGALVGGYVGDRIGRIKTVLVGGGWVCIGAIFQCSAQNSNWMICARMINGIGTGILNAIVPVWSAETSDYSSRGLFIAMEFTLNIFGVVLAYWLEYGLSFIARGDSQIRWRFPIAFQLIPLLLLIIITPFMPESPRWLIKVGRDEEAKQVLGDLRGHGDANDPKALAEFNEIYESSQLERKGNVPSYFEMAFTNCGSLHMQRRVQLVIWLQIVQEWVGIAAITVYQPTIFSQAGFSESKVGWLSGLNTITYMLSTLVAVATLDRWGRRFSLYWGAIGQGIALFLAGGFSRLAQNAAAAGHTSLGANYGAGAAFFVFLYTAIFGATWLTVPWIYPAEIWPLNVRAKGNAFGVVGWSIGNGWLTLLNPVMFAAIQEKTLYIFAACNFAAIIQVWAFYPETANRTLEEINFLFSSSSPFVWDAEKAHQKAMEEQPALMLARKVTNGHVDVDKLHSLNGNGPGEKPATA